MAVRVCVAIRESSTDEAVAAVARAAPWADLVEIRGDYIRDLDVRRLFRAKPCPLIFTLRSHTEGGEYRGSERNRLETILEASRCGADHVDVEFSAFWKVVLDTVGSQKLIISHHNFRETPSSLNGLVDRMADSGAGTIKIATRALSLADNLAIMSALKHAASRGVNLCALAMGLAGTPSRVLGGQWGSCMTFASLPGAQPTADGQISAHELLELYRVREIGPQTEIYGVVGRPIAHSLSPLIHNTCFTARRRDAVFLPLEAAQLEDFQLFDRCIPVRGASVTIPFKEDVLRRATSVSLEAERVGAANTLVRNTAGWHAENTDVDAFLQPLRRCLRLRRLRAVVLGAGGAARSVVYGLRSRGAAVCVVGRTPEKARLLAEAFQAEHAGWDRLPKLEWDLLVNATPVGMHPHSNESPVPADQLKGGWVYDLVYNPAETTLLREAAARGCKVIAGTEMFLSQAMKQQLLWLGPPVPEHVMRRAVSQALGCAVE